MSQDKQSAAVELVVRLKYNWDTISQQAGTVGTASHNMPFKTG